MVHISVSFVTISPRNNIISLLIEMIFLKKELSII